tara:strand:+ start:233 stop:988 length:756 start_codon:yes stop_codon:yes gene_type:complete
MNWLAKINLPLVIQRFGPYRSALLIVAMIAACWFVGYRMGNYYHGYQVQTLKEQKVRLDDLYATINETSRRIQTLEIELEVERLANVNVLNDLTAMKVDHYEVKKELAFYEKVMAPEKQAAGLAIDSIKVVATESKNHYRFQIALVQQLLKKAYVKGYVNLALIGSLNGKPKRIPLSSISEMSKSERAFSFQFFQLIAGEFFLPEGFVVEQIVVIAETTKNKWQKYKRIETLYPWPYAINKKALIKPVPEK